tara:strand:- start:6126 stop:6632 length:507 start_codon:yes stop_codon:yes gene_type:complete
MARYASGKKAWGYSDRSGFRYRLRDMIKEWNGLKVGRDEYEPKHPQLKPIRPGPDPTALYEPRPDSRTEVVVENLLGLNSFTSGSASSAVITVIEKSHGRSSSNTVRFRDVLGFDGFTATVLNDSSGYSITKVDDDTYTFTASSGTATIGSTRGGGGSATAGPATLGT